MLNSNTTPARRTWKISIPVIVEGACLTVMTFTVTAYRIGNRIISALVDGAAATLERVANLLNWARTEGKLELLEAVDGAQPATLSKRAASALHADLGRLGYTHHSHYEICSAAVGRELMSLTELHEAEVPVVWAHACLVCGYSIPATRYYGKAVAA